MVRDAPAALLTMSLQHGACCTQTMRSLSGSHSNHMEKREPIDLAAGATAVTAPSPLVGEGMDGSATTSVG